MTAETFRRLLKKLGACEEALEWSKDKDLKTVWETCERGDWLLWLCGYMADKPGWPTRQQLVLAACACAETALKYVPEGELRPKQAIDAARRWANGQCTIEEVREAAEAAAEAAWAAAEAAAEAAAWAAARAAWAAEAAWAAWAAAEAAWAAARAAEAAARAARAAARAAALKECADLVRKELRPVVIYGEQHVNKP
jgi:immunity protein 5 of polymorphic toxin system